MHKHLTRNGNVYTISVKKYINDLALLTSEALHIGNRIRITVDVADHVQLKPEIAIWCGMIVNELTNNAVLHGFPEHHKGTIRIVVEIKESKQVCIVVADSGVGMPDSACRAASDHLGLQLVRELAETQLRGECHIASTTMGTIARVFFPLQHEVDWSV